MYCQCVKEFGQPLKSDQRPDLLPKGTEVVLRITAVGLCHSDLHLKTGNYDLGGGQKLFLSDRGIKLPLVLGHEIVGVIESLGPEAGDLDTSRNYVIFPWQGCGSCNICQDGREHLCPTPHHLGVQADGGFADMIKIPHPRYLFDIGDLDPKAAAPLACSGLTAFSALKKVGTSLSEVPLVIIGAGGLGLMCIGLVKALGGLPPIVVDIDPNKRQAALEAGALVAVDGRAEDVLALIQKAAGGSIPAVIDFVGSENTAKLAFDVVGKGGKIVIVGLFGGASPWSLPLVALKGVSILGSVVGSMTEFRELLSLVVEGKVPQLAITTYPLESVNMAIEHLEAGRIIGRAVLIP